MALNIDIKEEQAKSQKVMAEQGLRVLVCAGTGCVACLPTSEQYHKSTVLPDNRPVGIRQSKYLDRSR